MMYLWQAVKSHYEIHRPRCDWGWARYWFRAAMTLHAIWFVYLLTLIPAILLALVTDLRLLANYFAIANLCNLLMWIGHGFLTLSERADRKQRLFWETLSGPIHKDGEMEYDIATGELRIFANGQWHKV